MTTPGAGEFVPPAYHDRSLTDVLPAVARALGVGAAFGGGDDQDPAPGLLLPEAGSYVVFLIDGLGYELLRDHAAVAPFLHSLMAGSPPATVGVPSTTATSLTSLGTALTPGIHGVVGFTARIPGTDSLLNALSWSREVDPAQWQPHPTAFGRLAAAGVQTTQVNKREFLASGLTEASSRGARFIGADRLGERLVAVQDASALTPSVTYMYDGDLDWTGHRYGVASAQWAAQLAMIDLAAERLRQSLPVRTRLVVVADHGMVDVGPERRIDVEDQPQLRDGLALIGGEARFRHLYCRGGAIDDVVATWRAVLGARAEVLSREEAFTRGWFGECGAAVLPRIGEVVVACRGDHAVLDTAAFPYEARLVGMHGSLTSAEMLIPVLVS